LKSFGATKKALEDKYTSDGIPAKEVVYERSMIGAQQHVVVDLIEELRKYSEVRQLDEAGMDILQNTIDYLNSVYNKLEEDHRANTEQLNQLDLSDDEINELWDEAVEERQE
jgi:tRNA pseudouridine-54 N-methylase